MKKIRFAVFTILLLWGAMLFYYSIELIRMEEAIPVICGVLVIVVLLITLTTLIKMDIEMNTDIESSQKNNVVVGDQAGRDINK